MHTNTIFLNLIYISLIFLSLFVFTSMSLSASHHILIFLPSVFFLFKATKKSNIKLSKSSLFLFLTIIWSIISVVANLEIIAKPIHNIFKLKYLVIGLLSVFSFRYFFQINREKETRILLRTFIITTTVATLSGLIAYYFGYNPLKMKPACHATRTCGMYGMYMTYGYGIALFLSILTGLLVYQKQLSNYLPKSLLISTFCINIFSFIFSFARGAYIGYFFSLPFFFLKRQRKVFYLIIAVTFSLFIAAIALIPKANKLVFDSSRMASVMIRVSQYKATIEAAKAAPFFGVGYKNFESQSNLIKKSNNIEHANFRGHGHSNFFEALGSTGFVGLALVILFHVFWLIETYKRNDLIGLIIFPFVVNFTISGQFQYTFGDGENLFMIMAIYALSQLPKLAPVSNTIEAK